MVTSHNNNNNNNNNNQTQIIGQTGHILVIKTIINIIIIIITYYRWAAMDNDNISYSPLPLNDFVSSYSTISSVPPDHSHSSSDLFYNNSSVISTKYFANTFPEHEPCNEILHIIEEPLKAPSLLHFQWIRKYGTIPDSIVVPTDQDTRLLQRYLNSSEYSNNNIVQLWRQTFVNQRHPPISKSNNELVNSNSVSVESIIDAAKKAKVTLTSETNIGGKSNSKATTSKQFKTTTSKQSKTTATSIIEINSDNNSDSDKSDKTDFNPLNTKDTKPDKKKKRRRRD